MSERYSFIDLLIRRICKLACSSRCLYKATTPLIVHFQIFRTLLLVYHQNDENYHDNPLSPAVRRIDRHLCMAFLLVSYLLTAHDVRRRPLPRQERKLEVNKKDELLNYNSRFV